MIGINTLTASGSIKIGTVTITTASPSYQIKLSYKNIPVYVFRMYQFICM